MAETAPSIRRICVVRLGGMGDILLTTPAVRALSQHFNTQEIDFIVGKGMKNALIGIPYIREVIAFDKDGDDASMPKLLAFLRRLRGKKYDLFLNFHPSLKTISMAAASGAPKVITFKKDRRRQIDTGRVRHAVDDFSKELIPLGIERVDDRQMDFFVGEADTQYIAALLSGEFGIQANEPLLVVNPAATRDINRWPPEKFVALLDRLSVEMPQLRIAVSGGKGDIQLATGIVNGLANPQRVANLAGRATIKQLGALLARANCVLTGDTGPLHIASAVGAPIVCLSGAADPDRTGPLGPRDLVVINRELVCVPCQARTCARKDIACMTQMPVDWVLNAIRQRIDPAVSFPCDFGATA